MSAALAVLVATAISLRGPVETTAAAFEKASPGEKIEIQAAASGVIVAQIEQGAPIDLFVSASPVEMDRIEKAGRLVAGTRRPVATNRLRIVLSRGVAFARSLVDLKEQRFDRIAIGNPKTVPAGRYAEQALKFAGAYDAVAPRLVFGENVRQVLDYVARGEAEAGIVYVTEAELGGDHVVLGPEIDAGTHDPIVYEAAVVEGGSGTVRATALLHFLASRDGQAILAARGFGPPPLAR